MAWSRRTVAALAASAAAVAGCSHDNPTLRVNADAPTVPSLPDSSLPTVPSTATSTACTTLTKQATPGHRPTGVAVGSDGAVWFIDWNAGAIGRVTSEGAVTELPTPTRDANPLGNAGTGFLPFGRIGC